MRDVSRKDREDVVWRSGTQEGMDREEGRSAGNDDEGVFRPDRSDDGCREQTRSTQIM